MKKTDQDYKKDQNTYNALTQNLKKLEVSQAFVLLSHAKKQQQQNQIRTHILETAREVKAGLLQKYTHVCWTEWDVEARLQQKNATHVEQNEMLKLATMEQNVEQKDQCWIWVTIHTVLGF